MRDRNARSRCDTRGFTLLETLVAFLIASLSLTVLLSGHRLALDGGSRMQSTLSAVLKAQDILAAAGASYDMVPSSTEGVGGGFDWLVEIEPFEDTGPSSPDILRLRVTVKTGAQSVTIETLRLARPDR